MEREVERLSGRPAQAGLRAAAFRPAKQSEAYLSRQRQCDKQAQVRDSCGIV
jgi:hypothetical protein